MVRAGILRDRITIQERSNTRNSVGEKIDSWSDVATVWAQVRPVSGRERLRSDTEIATTDILDYLVDLSPAKQRLYMPGVHLPIYHPDKIRETEPDYVLILPWNLSKEITKQLSFISAWGGKFVVPIPDLRVVDAL